MSKQSPWKKAMQILAKYGLWWETWEDVRDHALKGDGEAAKKALVDDYEFTEQDAGVLTDWLSAAIQGTHIELVEVNIADIVYEAAAPGTDEDDEEDEGEDESDPFEMPRYLARRGAFIDKLIVFQWVEDGKEHRTVWFKGKELAPSQIDQVWEVRTHPKQSY